MERQHPQPINDTTTVGARRAVEAAQDVASRAGGVVGERAERLAARAPSLAHEARAGLGRVAGPRLEEWTAPLRRLVRDHPLRAVALMVGAGYLLGKLTRRS